VKLTIQMHAHESGYLWHAEEIGNLNVCEALQAEALELIPRE
jgi:hypothetical protein